MKGTPDWVITTLTILALVVALIGAAAAISALPSSDGALRFVYTTLLVVAFAVAIGAGLILLLRSTLLRMRTTEDELRQEVDGLRKLVDGSRRSLDEYKRALWDVASRHHYDYSERFHAWIYIGSGNEGDHVQEDYCTTATSEHGLLWRGIDVGSSTAAELAGGQLTVDGSRTMVIPIDPPSPTGTPGPTFHTTLLEMLCEDRRLTGMVIFQPAVEKGQSVSWRATYSAPGTWSKLREGGRDWYGIFLDRPCPTCDLEIIFPSRARSASCAVEIPPAARAAGISQICSRVDDGGITRLRWHADNAPEGPYKFNLQVDPAEAFGMGSQSSG